jgi:hypothetical protein
LEQNVDVVLARVKARESPILIRNGRKADALLFNWEDHWRRLSILHTPKEIAEIKAACLGLNKAAE